MPIVEILWWNEAQNFDLKNQNKSWNENVAEVREWLNYWWKEIWKSQKAIKVEGGLES